MSIWTFVSWIGVVVLTGVNIFIFLKLKQAAEQMMQVAFPGAKNMQDAMARMQSQLGAMRGSSSGRDAGKEAQLRQAIEMLQNVKKKR